ncbi:Hypothetical protein DHA2_151198 [Giardia duodenalis]|uniref:Uncharacterized protein n=1 Tax=Giardia intestinalis TaxID=5741 RepID=V6TLV8_GIAIN|nr:Hypothetical protein DHA2_151198 [Giardia intestinalis]
MENLTNATMPEEATRAEENYSAVTETNDIMDGSTCVIDPSIAVSLHCGSTVDKATSTGELDRLPFLRGTTAVVQTEIALHTKSQCQIYIPIIKQYAKSIAKDAYRYDRSFYCDTVEPALDPIKLSYDVDVLKEQNEEFLRRIVEMQTEIDKHARTIYQLALEKQRLMAVEEDLRAQLKQTSEGGSAAPPTSQTLPFGPTEFVLRDINGDILFDERLLPPDSETLLYVVKGGDRLVTYHIFTDIDEFLSLKKQQISSRNVKLQIGPSCLHPRIWQ